MTVTRDPRTPLSIPPLESGDRLSRPEFERRYEAMPQSTQAELLEGTVFMASPLRAQAHGKPHARMMGWLIAYEAATPGVEVLDNPTVRLDADNEPQPDAVLRMENGGQSTISEDDYIEGAPELIIEIAASSASLDLGAKLQVYQRNQVQEYLVWRVYDGEFDWFELQNNQYIQLAADSNDILHSRVFPGLWLDRGALLKGDLATVLAVLQQGMASQEHQAYVQKR
ncbi:MAG: Uma2 family endonuclease [Synechococcaceae cyanobacterium]|nr:Uma2 family endonuclease [Synechococcaceae cyanobacterium]